MTDYFVDNTLTTGLEDGTSTDDAYHTLKEALESGVPSGSNTIWWRRGSNEIPPDDISPTSDGNIDGMFRIIGWPRNAYTGTADVYNGFPAFVDVSNTGDITRLKHQARMIKNDTDGNEYFITAIGYWVPYENQASSFIERETITTVGGFSGEVLAIKDDGATGHVLFSPGWTGTISDGEQLTSGVTDRADANGDGEVVYIIDRAYQGSDDADGNYTIIADDDYTEAQAIDDSTWTIKLSTWTADADTIPTLDANDGSYPVITVSDDYYYEWKNLEFKDTESYYGLIRMATPCLWRFQGCLFAQNTANDNIINFVSGVHILDRCTFEGKGSGVSQRVVMSTGTMYAKNIAIYNMGDYGLRIYGSTVYLKNSNIGVELPNVDDDLNVYRGGCYLYGRDVKLGGDNGEFGITDGSYTRLQLSIENYQKVLGAHKGWYLGGTWEKAAVSGETPNKKVSDYVIKITPDRDEIPEIDDAVQVIFTHEFEATTDSKTYKYWLFNNASGTLNDVTAKDDIWIEAEYVVEYTDSIEEYIITKKLSTETDILNAADADDWDYLQVSAVQPATASKVRITCKCRAYSASGTIFVDPAVVIS